MARTIYRCRFRLTTPTIQDGAFDAYSEEGIIAFKNGFWVDHNYSYIKTGGVRYWVPPHRIEYISKEQTE